MKVYLIYLNGTFSDGESLFACPDGTFYAKFVEGIQKSGSYIA